MLASLVCAVRGCDRDSNCRCRMCGKVEHSWDHSRQKSVCRVCQKECTHPNMVEEDTQHGTPLFTQGSYYAEDGCYLTTTWDCPDCGYHDEQTTPGYYGER